MGNLSHSRKIVTGSDDAPGASQKKELPSSVHEKVGRPGVRQKVIRSRPQERPVREGIGPR